MNLKILSLAAVAAFALLVPTVQASAQCLECASHPERDPLNGGQLTPAGKMGLVNAHGAASTSNGSSGSLAAARKQYLDASAQAASPKKHVRKPASAE
jgi:hypothetical protein